eukprot:14531424-Alexandrium_andersonii.AAC.1
MGDSRAARRRLAALPIDIREGEDGIELRGLPGPILRHLLAGHVAGTVVDLLPQPHEGCGCS